MRVLGVKYYSGIREVNEIAFIDNDVFVEKYTLYKLSKKINEREEIGSISPIIIGMNNELQWIGNIFDKTMFTFLKYPVFIRIDKGLYLTGYPIGAIYIMKKNISENVFKPPIDTNFWYEDLVVGYRLWYLGKPPAVYLGALAQHLFGATRKRGRKTRGYYLKNYTDLYKTRIVLATKYFGSTWGLITYFVSVFDSLAIYMGLDNDPYRFIYSIKGLNTGLHGILWSTKYKHTQRSVTELLKKLLNVGTKIHLLNLFPLTRRNIGEYFKQLSEAVKQILFKSDVQILEDPIPNNTEEQLLSNK